MTYDLLEAIVRGQQSLELAKVIECNELSQAYGLSLSEEDAAALLAARAGTLREQQRIEFAGGILPKLIEVFCDSPYINQEDYCVVLSGLQEIFYLYKNESLDLLTDAELLIFMKEQYDSVCFGSADYLAETCLERFARAIRAGYGGYERSGGRGEYDRLSEETRWEKELFLTVWNELIK